MIGSREQYGTGTYGGAVARSRAASFVSDARALTTAVSDSFNRADTSSNLGTPDVGPAWDNRASTLIISGNKVVAIHTLGGGLNTITSGQNDGIIEVDVTTPAFPTDHNLGIVFRWVGASDYLSAFLHNGALDLKYGQTATLSVANVYNYGATVRLRVEFEGARIRVLIDDAVIADVTMSGADLTYYASTTAHGLAIVTFYDGSFDNYKQSAFATIDAVTRAVADTRGVGAYIAPTIADIIDSFDRANAGSLGTADSGGTWAAGNGTWSIASNKAAPTAGAGRIVSTIAHKVDGVIEADITTLATVNTYALGFVFRYVDSNNFLTLVLSFLGASGVIAQISKYDANVQTVLVTKGSVYKAGNTVRASVEFVGATLRAFVDGIPIGTYSMTGAEQTKYNAATTIGLISFSSLTGGTIDNFRAASITADSIARSVADGRVPADSAPAADAAARSSSGARSEADAATAADTLTRAIVEGRGTADSAPGSDLLGRSEANARAVADSGPASDALSRSETAGRSSTDAASATDALGRTTTDARTTTDTSPAADALDRALGSARLASDSGPASDTTGMQGAYGRAPDDSAPAVDDLASAAQRERDLSGSAPSADGMTRSALTGRTAADSSPSSDAVDIVAASLGRSPADIAPSSDALQRASDAQRAAASSAGVSDVVEARAAFIRALTNPVTASDALRTFVVRMRALADTSPAIEALMRIGAFLRQQHDAAPASGKAKARVPTPYVPSPTRADAEPSQNILGIDASRNEADVVPSANANDITRSKNSTDVVRSRTRAEVKR